MTRSLHAVTLLLTLIAAAGCRRQPDAPHGAAAGGAAESWSVTAWGEAFEVFAETDPLIAGGDAVSNAHVTVLADFSPLREGTVTAILRDAGGSEAAFLQDRPKRDGIYAIVMRPQREGTFDLVFRVDAQGATEEVEAGRVRVGSASSPGRLQAEAAREDAGALPFLKEQQWRTAFATARAREGTVRESVRGPALVLPARGGEAVLTAGIDATVLPEPWPHRGLDVSRGEAVFRLLPRPTGRSVPGLEADAAALEAEAAVARKRVERLTELLRLEATSPAELERARAALAGLDAKLAAARRDLESATGARGGATGDVAVRAPLAGRVAEVTVSPGQAVAANSPLGRLVRLRPLWLEVALRPGDARRVQGPLRGIVLKPSGGAEARTIPPSEVRLVSRSPELDAKTASVAVIVEIDRSATELPIGSGLEAEVLLAGERRGLLVPTSALVDDGGASVLYVQLEGETFARREVRVVAHQGERTLVEGVREGDRVVIRGGAAIRRASLLSSGAPEGHVH